MTDLAMLAPEPVELLPSFPILPTVVPPFGVGPSDVYLASLAKASRGTMQTALRWVARVAGFENPAQIPWHLWRYEHTAAVRAAMVDQNLSPSTAEVRLSALRRVLKEAWRLGLLSAEELARAIDVPKVKGFRLPKGRSLEDRDIAKIFLSCPQHEPRRSQLFALFGLMLGGGLRIHEALTLPLDHLDADRWTARVLGKGNKERFVPLAPSVRPLIEPWLRLRGTAPGPVVCCVLGSGQVTRRSLGNRSATAALLKIAHLSGVELTSHDFRRTYATRLFQSGVDAVVIAKLLGHESLDTTKKYDKRGDADLYTAARCLRLPGANILAAGEALKKLS